MFECSSSVFPVVELCYFFKQTAETIIGRYDIHPVGQREKEEGDEEEEEEGGELEEIKGAMETMESIMTAIIGLCSPLTGTYMLLSLISIPVSF